jgi:acyl-coenzyme A synthetase/AMP-(fatty) acid ligase
MRFSTGVEAVAYWASATPDTVCMIDAVSGEKLTYAEFWSFVVHFSEILKNAGLTVGERVTVKVRSLAETFIAQYGVYLAGGVYCPVEKNLKETKLTEMLAYFESGFLVSDKPVNSNIKWIDIALTTEIARGYVEPTDVYFPDAEELCAIIFTTGTTGKAKGVMVNHKGNTEHAYMRCELFEFTKDDVFMWVQPIHATPGVKMCVHSFLLGATMVHNGGIVFLKEFYKSLGTYGVTCLQMQPTSYVFLLRDNNREFENFKKQLKAVIIGGGFLTEKYKLQLKEMLPETKIYVNYGATEIAPISCFEYSLNYSKINSVGKPTAISVVKIINDDGEEIINSSEKNCGIVECESVTAMLGYWNEPELTKKYLTGNKVRLTDSGYFDNDGYLYLMGRRDDVIVSGEYKIAPYEIENVITKMSGIAEAVCIAEPNAILGNTPKLFVEMENGTTFSSKEITTFLLEHLETYKLPRKIRQIDKFPRIGANQKIDRKALKSYD